MSFRFFTLYRGSHRNDLPYLFEDHLTASNLPTMRRMRVTSSRRCNLGQRPDMDVTYFSYFFVADDAAHVCCPLAVNPAWMYWVEFPCHSAGQPPLHLPTFAGHDAQDRRKAWTRHENSRHHQPSTALRNKPRAQSEQWTASITQRKILTNIQPFLNPKITESIPTGPQSKCDRSEKMEPYWVCQY